MSNREKWSEG